ncbi:hypothetical protein Taro_054364 [Colocasia esculenta]|uniref:Uncharacterized protein n=1 Tax=Colocasia esculenta TaxID=4460 RepID=A0A843XQV7_COLES|nr:hypothetical protein [Colocasia esculenta]
MTCCRMSDARKCCSCRRDFGTRRLDVSRKRGPWAEQAIRDRPRDLEAVLEKTWRHAEGPRLSVELGWAMMGLAHEGG